MSVNDYVRPFMLSQGAVRGRITRLVGTSAIIIGRHDYPDAVSRLLAELLALAAMLSSQLKADGIVTIQLRGNGPVSLVVVDAITGGELRGYADFAPEEKEMLAAMPADTAPKKLIGDDGYLAITLDQREAGQRYQGVVALEGNSLGDALENYFANSQQLEMRCQIAAQKNEAGKWNAGAMLVERLAYEGGEGSMSEDAHAESWRYAQASAQTVTDDELVDITLPVEEILFRLFHEEGVEVFEETPLSIGCRCSRERMLNVLNSMHDDDKTEMIVDGVISVHCQFCNTAQEFTPDEIGVSVN